MSTTESTSINVAPFLSPDYDHRGNLLRLKDNTEFYACGDASRKQGVILIPDMLGWNTGRIRNIADFFASQGCLAAIPKLSGSTEGAPSGPSYFESASIGDYMKSLTFESNLKPKIASVVKYMQHEGIEKIALVGFNWGGWVVTNILASELADQFVCGALPHPSINLEERVYGGSLMELMSRVDRPLLLMPAKGDPDEYRLLMKMIKFKLPTSDVIDYHNLEHGFLLRGTVADPEIRQACDKSLREIMSFFNHHFQMDPSQLVRHIEKEGFTRETSKPKTLYERVGEVGQWAAEKLPFVGREGSEYARVQGAKLGQDTNEAVEQWKEQAERAADQDVPQRIEQSQDYLSKQAQGTFEYVKEGASKIGQKVQETGEYLGDQVRQTYDKTKEGASDVANRTQESYDRTKESAQKTGEQVGEQSQHGYDKAKDTGKKVYEKGKEYYNQAADQAQQGYDKAKDSAQKTGEQARDYASETGKSVGEQTKQTGEQIKQASLSSSSKKGNK